MQIDDLIARGGACPGTSSRCPRSPALGALGRGVAAAAGRTGRGEVERARAGSGLGLGLDDAGGGLDAGLGLARAGRRAPAQPRQLLAGQDLARRLVGRRLLLALGLALEVGVVAAVVDVAGAAVELEHLGRDPVEHVAVVGHQDQPAPERGQAVLEPGDGVDVEVVGGLVEDEQVAVGHQRAGQRDPLGLTARQRRRCRRRRSAPMPEPIEHRLGLPPRRPPRRARARAGSTGFWSSMAMRTPAPADAPGRTRARPAPASTRSSVDFPQPLRPTMPMRSPVETVTDRSAKRGLPGRETATRWASTRITGGRVPAGPCRVRSPAPTGAPTALGPTLRRGHRRRSRPPVGATRSGVTSGAPITADTEPPVRFAG